MYERPRRHVGDAEYGPSCPRCASPKSLDKWYCRECATREQYLCRRRDERGRWLPHGHATQRAADPRDERGRFAAAWLTP